MFKFFEVLFSSSLKDRTVKSYLFLQGNKSRGVVLIVNLVYYTPNVFYFIFL